MRGCGAANISFSEDVNVTQGALSGDWDSAGSVIDDEIISITDEFDGGAFVYAKLQNLSTGHGDSEIDRIVVGQKSPLTIDPTEHEFILPDDEGSSVPVTVTLPEAAPAGGVEISFGYNPDVISTSDDVVAIPEGDTQAVVDVSPLAPGLTDLTASADEYADAATEFAVRGTIFLKSPKDEISVGQTDTLTIELDPAPVDGAQVDLTFDDMILDVIPAQVVLPPLQKETPVTVQALDEGEAAVTASAALYVSGEKLYTVVAGVLVPGDVDGDGCVNVADLLTVRNNLGNTGSDIFPETADVSPETPDGVVNVADLLYVRNRLGDGPGCPE